MGISIDLYPMVGLSIIMRLDYPMLSFIIGPFLIRIGDLDNINEQASDE